VGSGSSYAQARRAYCARLKRVAYSLYGASHGYRVVAPTQRRLAIAFEMSDDGGEPYQVHTIRFGQADALNKNRDWLAVGAGC
jgi:hypothetical protein